MVSRKLMTWQSMFSKIIHYSRTCFRKNLFKSISCCIKNKFWNFIYPFLTFKYHVHKRVSIISRIKYSQITNCQCCKIFKTEVFFYPPPHKINFCNNNTQLFLLGCFLYFQICNQQHWIFSKTIHHVTPSFHSAPVIF